MQIVVEYVILYNTKRIQALSTQLNDTLFSPPTTPETRLNSRSFITVRNKYLFSPSFQSRSLRVPFILNGEYTALYEWVSNLLSPSPSIPVSSFPHPQLVLKSWPRTESCVSSVSLSHSLSLRNYEFRINLDFCRMDFGSLLRNNRPMQE